MNEQKVRETARRLLPDRVRKPLGWLCGSFYSWIIQPIAGFLFVLKGRHFTADGCRLFIPPGLTSIRYCACFFFGTYEEEERELIREFVRPEDSVLEVGACLGVVSCVTNRLLRVPSRHVVVEANPFCIPAIHRNRDLNRGGFLVENCALATTSEVTFYLHPVYIVGGTTERKSNREVRVPGRTLEELEQRYGPFSVLIMDIEGAELETFKASRALLGRYRMIIVELHEWAIGDAGVEECRQILREAGFDKSRSAGRTEAWRRST